MKFIVAQTGARRGYAVPAILEKAGMLERFYTDITGDLALGKLFSSAACRSFIGKSAHSLAGRRLPSNIGKKTITFPGISLMYGVRRVFTQRDPVAAFRESLRLSNALGRAMTRRGFGNATHLYSMLGECGPLLVAAKERGLTVISEIYIPLSAERIMADERKRFSVWEPETPDYAAIRREIGDKDVVLTRTDFAICPSEAVREDLVMNWGVWLERTAVVPYGMNPELFAVRNDPVRGRVLFAGTAELRKGIHYLAMAAEKLAARGRHYEFRVAGNVHRSIASQKQCRYLTFLGRVPRAEIVREFATADVLVLPSLVEGSAETTYEALACGVPVVATPETGSVVRDGIEGRIVPSRDPKALADAIVEIIEDREKRACMSSAAREGASNHTLERYSERLVGALKSFALGQPARNGPLSSPP